MKILWGTFKKYFILLYWLPVFDILKNIQLLVSTSITYPAKCAKSGHWHERLLSVGQAACSSACCAFEMVLPKQADWKQQVRGFHGAAPVLLLKGPQSHHCCNTPVTFRIQSVPREGFQCCNHDYSNRLITCISENLGKAKHISFYLWTLVYFLLLERWNSAVKNAHAFSVYIYIVSDFCFH